MNFLKNTLLVAGSLSITLLLMEGGTRLFSTLMFPKMMELDDRLGWRHAHNRTKDFENPLGEIVTVRQNRFGHRGPNRTVEKRSGLRRFLVLGDSFTEAVQVAEESTFTALLEDDDSELEVWNAGVGGYGTVQEYLYLKDTGDAFDADLVLVMFYLNDLTDNCLAYSPGFGPRPYARMQNAEVIIEEQLDYATFGQFALRVPFWEVWNRHSYLYNFVNTRFYQRFTARQLREIERADLDRVRSACAIQEVVHGMFGKIASFARANRAVLAAVLIPSAREAEQGIASAHAGILASCISLGIACMSLTEALHQAIVDGSQPYFEKDIHWTAEGHRIAAREIAAFVDRPQLEGSSP